MARLHLTESLSLVISFFLKVLLDGFITLGSCLLASLPTIFLVLNVLTTLRQEEGLFLISLSTALLY